MTDSQQTQSPPPAVDPVQRPPATVVDPTQTPPPRRPPTGSGLAVTALILGVLALLGAFVPFINYGSGLLALVGLVLGAIALARRTRSKGVAIGGVVTSALGLLLSIILASVYTIGFAAAVKESLGTTNGKTTADSGSDSAKDDAGGAELGTRENPAPLGTTIELSSGGAVEYEVTLGASTLLANDAVAAANQFNAAPPEGLQFALVPVTVTYMGTEAGTPWMDVSVEFISAAGTTHTGSDVSAVGPAPSMMDLNDLYPGAVGTGNVVIAIPTADAASGTWAVSSLFGGDPFFFAAE